ncbi:uncharacterized protein J7T54_001678 [Emericellopsis cladophorae]|uniref:N-acetylglucosamine-induced protein 1 n=1 Tax=Emericellopsis cladophorae TaxID=2686198 RepID=A0A9Q0BFT7_9HYPO|nr:uncharacterized protein J7T54_001678 [Emericellopsis cladophorae]KAI6783802.1 hypothetical protein J7T54_001678 [Emericellopsis cladophorae]
MGSCETPAFWNVNIPPEQQTTSCPDYLQHLTPKDVGIIATPDSEYTAQSWDEVREIVATNSLENFKRVPSDLRRYRAIVYRLVQDYGSVHAFLLKERLRWEEPVKPRGAPFELEDDYKILFNDWPYGVDKKIVHLVVWTKFALAEDPKTGDMTDQARRDTEAFMEKAFYKNVPRGRVIWFKNWAALKSVDAVEHFHVMMYDPDQCFVQRVTQGDVPQCLREAH